MISRKELGYVNLWANRVPYPGDNYCEEAMDYLKKSVKLFEEAYNGNKYNITFSNNEEIELEIKSRNLAHMLGIDTKNIFNEYFKNFRENVIQIDTTDHISSFEILQSIIDNFEKVIEFDKKDSGIKALNYYKVFIKSSIFFKLGNLGDFKYSCINFDKEEFLKNNDNKIHNAKSTKFLYLPSDEPICPYFAMGILPDAEQRMLNSNIYEENDIQNEVETPYVVETLIALDNPKPFFKDQEVIIPTQILKDTNKELTRLTPTPTQKKNLLKEYKNIITQYGLDNRINIYNDYYSMLSTEEEKAIKLVK